MSLPEAICCAFKRVIRELSPFKAVMASFSGSFSFSLAGLSCSFFETIVVLLRFRSSILKVLGVRDPVLERVTMVCLVPSKAIAVHKMLQQQQNTTNTPPTTLH